MHTHETLQTPIGQVTLVTREDKIVAKFYGPDSAAEAERAFPQGAAPQAAPGDYKPIPEAVELARLLSADTSPEGMAAVLSGFLRSMHQDGLKAENGRLRDALKLAQPYIKHDAGIVHAHVANTLAETEGK